MINIDNTSNVIVKRSIALAQRTTGSAVTAGAAIAIKGVERIVHVLSASARAAGTVGIQDVQFANDSSFTENVSTYTSDDYLNKNNALSSSSAIAQTLLSAAGSAKVSLANLAINGQEYMRVRAVQSSGSPDATFEVQTVLFYADSPKIQS